jgi:hypothetical protein
MGGFSLDAISKAGKNVAEGRARKAQMCPAPHPFYNDEMFWRARRESLKNEHAI